MSCPYYTVLKEEHSHSILFEYQINWNVSAISGTSNACGFVVQHFKRHSTPSNFVVNDCEYWEAWKVQEGICLDRGEKCDDVFDLYTSLANAYKNSIGTAGQYIIDSEVYWVPATSDLYSKINSWSSQTVPNAGGLKSSYERPWGIDPFFVFKRPQFIHTWSLIEEMEICEKLLATYLRFCPQYSDRDVALLTSHLDYIFDGKSNEQQKNKSWILTEWKKIRLNEQ